MTGGPFAPRVLRNAPLLCLVVVIALQVTSCGSYTAVSSGRALSEAGIWPGTWVRVTTIRGEQFTDKVASISSHTLVCREHVVRFEEIRSLERYHPLDFKLLALVAGMLAYIGLVLAMR